MLGTALLIAAAAASAPALANNTTSTSLTACLSQAGVTYLTQSSGSAWDVAEKPFNLRLQFTPAAIALPTSPNEVASAVQCAARAGVKVNAKGGGHSYASSAYGGEDGHLTIDLAKLNKITVDGKLAHVQGGSHLGDVALALNAQGRAMPHGVCPYVGVGGHASYGGYGFYSSRYWGMVVDRIQAMEVVTADGVLRNISKKGNDTDLFWAMAGAGPSYGVITSYTFSTQSRPSNVVLASYTWDNLTSSTASSVLQVYQNFTASSAPSAFGAVLNIGKGKSSNTIKYVLDTTYIGLNGTHGAIMAPLLRQLPAPQNSTKVGYKWIDAVQQLAGSQKLNTSLQSDYNDDFYAASIMTPESRPVSKAAYDAFTQYLANQGYASRNNWFVQVELYGGNNSKINAPNRTATAFVHRNSQFTFQMYASSPTYGPPYPQDGIPFIQNMSSTLTGTMGADWPYEAYQNYIDTQLNAASAQKLYWGENWSRLASIKQKYDPTNLFKLPAYQAV